MRTITISILILLSTIAFSQKKIKVSEGSEKYSVGQANTLTAEIYEADKKQVEKAWKKLLKKNKGKVSSKSEMIATNVIIKKMGDKDFDVYTLIEESSEGIVTIKVAFDLGGAFLSKSLHPDRFKAAKKFVYNFCVDISKDAVNDKIKEQEKVLGKFEKEQKKLVKEKEKLKKEIEDFKQKIQDNEKAIEGNEKNQETKTQEIEKQRTVVVGLTEKEKAIK